MTQRARKIAIIGMLVAAQVVADRFISISLPITKIGFTFLPRAIAAILYGPLWGGLAAALGDFLAAILGPYGYFPPITISAFLTGAIYGLFLYKKPASFKRVCVCVLVESVFVSILLQTYWLTLLTGKGYLALLPARLTQNAVTVPVAVICIHQVAYRIAAVVEKLGIGARAGENG